MSFSAVGAQRFTMDLAVLAVATALLHYALGVYGLTACLLLLAVAEHGQAVWTQIRSCVDQLWTMAAVGRRRTHPISESPSKEFHRRSTQQFVSSPPSQRRRRSSAWTEAESSDGEGADVDHHLLEDEDATTTTAEDPLRHHLFAKLTIRDLTSPPTPRSPPTSTTSSATTASTDSRPPRNSVELNSVHGVPFENDLFVGRVLFLVRTTPVDTRWMHLFEGKRRMFWIQVQGRFKRKPRGVVYLGGELPSRVSLGFFTKSIALVIVGIIQQLVGLVYVSFGGAVEDANERPCVSFPLYQSVDQFTVTAAGGATPPPLGADDFGETEDARRRRRRAPLNASVFEVGPTYSFHFHTMYVDLTRWQTANLPGLHDMSLTAFFDSLPLRLVAYDVPATPADKHIQSQKQYLFNFDITYDADGVAREQQQRRWRSDSEQSIASSESNSTTTTTSSSPSASLTLADALATIERDAAAKLEAIHALEYLYWVEEVDAATSVRRVQYVYRIHEDGDARLVVVSAYQLRLLVAGKFRNLPQAYALQSLRFHARSRIGSYSIIAEEALQVARCLTQLLRHVQSGSTDSSALAVAFEAALYQILTARPHLQVHAPLNGPHLEVTPSSVGVQLSKRDREALQVVFEGVVYRFYADGVARQEVLVATPHTLQFFRSFSTSPDKETRVDRVIGVHSVPVPLASADCGFAFAFQINTFAEEMVVCVATEHARNAWVRVVLQHCSPHANFDRSVATEPLLVCATPAKPLQPLGRVVLNSRSLFPRAGSQGALAVVAAALHSALVVHRLGDDADVTAVLDFLDHASALRTIDLPALLQRPHEDRLVFFVNVYHVILAHAMIAHGYPRSKGQWAFFQTHMCYAIGRDPQHPTQPLTISLAEIEHVVLRARLPRASELPHLDLGKLPAVNAERVAAVALAHPDFRVSFALLMNRSPSHDDVRILDPSTVHEQLNALVQQAIAELVSVDVGRKTITLPQLCEWFKHDFGGGGSPLYCVRKLLGFMADEMQARAMEVLDSPRLVHIKYGAFAYTPRARLTPVDK